MPVFCISAGARLAQLLVLQLLIDGALGRRFDSIDDCRTRVIRANETTPALNLTFMLTLPQCYEYCGTGYGTYNVWSVISALSSWVIPLFLLLGNVTYAKISCSIFDIGKMKLGYIGNWIAVISHLLANPIDFLWSLSLKLDVGHEIKRSCDEIAILAGSPNERKDLSAISFALDDFEDGIHVKTLLEPLGDKSICNFEDRTHEDTPIYVVYHTALQGILSSAARDLADARKHNKLHSTLAILIYGKEVFEALINTKLDGTFPYHMPHTLALRQIYYWLFLAIILSAAAGGFASQWTSLAILERFLKERREALQRLGVSEDIQRRYDIVLEPLKPWNGGNYSWRHRKDGVSERSGLLFLVALAAVALPVVSAFLISWFTPTVGLGDRGIMELSFAGLWGFNWILTHVASKFLASQSLFRIMWWNLFWSLASLTVLFTAFQGWFNSCESWSAYYSRGAAGAVLDLNMKDVEENDIFIFYLPMVIAALVIQLSLAGLILRPNKDILKCTVWSDGENRSFREGTRQQGVIEPSPSQSVTSVELMNSTGMTVTAHDRAFRSRYR